MEKHHLSPGLPTRPLERVGAPSLRRAQEESSTLVERMAGVARGAEEHERQSFDGSRRGRARSIWLRGRFEMTARLDADELTRAFDRDPELANARAWASERARCPGLVECNVAACNAILPWAFTKHALRAFDAGAKKLEFDIDVCLQATGKASPSSTPYR